MLAPGGRCAFLRVTPKLASRMTSRLAASRPVARCPLGRCVLLALFVAPGATPKTAGAQPPADSATTYIRAARVFDGEKGGYSGPVVIRVKGGVIEAVEAQMSVPAGARVVDLS